MKILVLLMQTSLTQACLLRLRVACFYRCGLKIIQLLMLSVHLSEIVLIHFNVSFVLYLFQILFICGGEKSPFILRSFPFSKIFNFYSRYYFHSFLLVLGWFLLDLSLISCNTGICLSRYFFSCLTFLGLDLFDTHS